MRKFVPRNSRLDHVLGSSSQNWLGLGFLSCAGNVVIYFTLRRYLPDRKHALYNRDHVPLQIEIATLSRFAFARSPQSRAKMIVSSYPAARLCGESASGRVTKIAIDKRPRASENKGNEQSLVVYCLLSGRLRDEEAAGSADPAHNTKRDATSQC